MEIDYFKNLNKMIVKERKYTNMWITLNKECNMRCKWCYAREKGYEKDTELTLEDVEDLVELASELGIRNVTLIGGEPTIYKELIKAVEIVKKRKMKAILVTNGKRLADEAFLKQLIQTGLDALSISVKGHDEEVYKNKTGVYGLHDVHKAINNISDFSIDLLISVVVTPDNIDYLVNIIDDCKRFGATDFSFSFSYDFTGINKKSTYDINTEIFDMIDKFQEKYDEINNATEGNFRLKQSFPLCAWDLDFITKMEERGQMNYVCQFLKNSGVVFNEKKEIIPCNAMYEIVVGKYGQDFYDAESFMAHVESRKIKRLFQQLRNLPDRKCLACPWMIKCRGGCVSNWYNFSMSKFEEYKQERKKNVT